MSGDPRDLLERLFALFDQVPEGQYKALALLTKVNSSQPGRWKKALKEERPIPTKLTTRKAIASILRGEEGPTEGWEDAAEHLRATLKEMEDAAALRKELVRLARQATSTAPDAPPAAEPGPRPGKEPKEGDDPGKKAVS